MLLDQPFPPDERPYKEAQSLIADGHDVHLLCVTHDSEQPIDEDVDGIQVHRFHYPKSQHNKFSAAYLVLPIHRRRWSHAVAYWMTRFEADIIHVHDLPLSDVAFSAARIRRIPVVCDQHEYFSKWIRNTAHYNTALGKIVKWLSPWQRYEHRWLNQAALVITVEEPLRQMYLEHLSQAPENIICVPNTPIQGLFQRDNRDPEVESRYADDFVVFYAGVMDVLRGLDLIWRSLPDLVERVPNIRFVLAGRLAKGCDPKAEAERIGLGDRVDFIGWLNRDQLPQYMNAADICFFTPKNVSDEINRTIATKNYQYALLGKPTITSDVKMMAAFVRDNGLGTVIKDGDAAAFADAIVDYARHPEKIEEIAKRSAALSDRYHWDATVQTMLERYRELL